jgi:hypothetical protein
MDVRVGTWRGDWGCIINDHPKTYSDDEFAMILAKAAELSAQSGSQGDRSHGLSLLEMKTIAREVGLDPEFVERAAHLVPAVARSTIMGRLFGGPLSSQLDFYVPVRLTTESAGHLLSLVRATLVTHGRGEAAASGMSFSSWEGGSKVFVSAHVDGDGTRIRVLVDNRSRLIPPLLLAPVGTLLVVALAVGVGGTGPNDPATGLPWVVLGIGIPAVAGLVWRSIRKTAQRTLRTLDDLIHVMSSYIRGGDAS